MRELQREGKIGHVGLSEVSVSELEKARGIIPIVTGQNRYNLVDRGAEDVLDHCEKIGVGFIPWFPLATGKLAAEGGPLARAAERLKATPSQVALAWLLARSPMMLPIPGTSSVRHLEENTGGALLELLAIAKGIVEAHGGRIWVESEVGCGPTFYFTLAGGADTRRWESALPVAAPAAALRSSGAGGERVITR